MTSAPTYKIHPAIGIARLGNSPNSFYIAPEATGAAPIDCDMDGNPSLVKGVEQPVSQYKDANNQIRRQAARFRIYVYDEENPEGRELKLGDTVTAAKIAPTRSSGQLVTGTLVDVNWTVYLANKKASWYEFQQLEGQHGYSPTHPLRNADITGASHRQELIIDPGPRTVAWKNPKQRKAAFAKGTSAGTPETFPPSSIAPNPITTLGQLISTTDTHKHNRLLVLGGLGNSGSARSGVGEPSIQTYANNDGWFDDTSDGPVNASLVIQVATIDGAPVQQKTQMTIGVNESAWVITGYPRYAPQIVDMVTMDEIIYDVAVRSFNYEPRIYSGGKFNNEYYPYFWRDIWPVLQRPNVFQFVCDIDPINGAYPHETGKNSGGNFDPTILSIPPFAGEDPQDRKNRANRRMFLYHVLRKPGQENRLYVDSSVPGRTFFGMPLLCGDNPITNDLPSKFLCLTDTMLFLLRQWAEGKFINEQLENITPPAPPEAAALDRGVLGNGLGGAFCPGGETSWIIRNPAIYKSAYRINTSPAPVPGSLSQPVIIGDADTPSLISKGLEPGDITKYSGVPWQSDFNECSTQDIDVNYELWNQVYPDSTGDKIPNNTWTTYWWPAHRPNMVNGKAWSPTPNSNQGDITMVSIWWQLGFVVPAPGSTPDNPAFILTENQLGGNS